jgi:SAM-dependent methyltransferase
MLGKLLHSIGKDSAPAAPERPAAAPPKVLNVGGNSKIVGIPPHYNGWVHHLLDIDPRGKPDILADARELLKQPAATYDAIYCAHNLEHYLHHDARKVLKGFLHVLKDDGFAEIKVPDILAVMKRVVAEGLDLDDQLYVAPSGPIQVRDVVWGYGVEIESSGNDFYAHKTGFSPKSLTAFLENAGFAEVFLDGAGPERLEVAAIAFKRAGPNLHKASFGLA